MDPTSKFKLELIDEIIEQRFGRLLKWKKPNVVEGVGPFDPTVFDDFQAELAGGIANITNYLDARSFDELWQIFRSHAGESSSANVGFLALVGQVKLILEKEPRWFSGGFSVVERSADYDYWLRMKTWSLSEAVALSIGFEPSDEYSFSNPKTLQERAIIEFYEKRKNVLFANFEWIKNNETKSNEVGVICDWFQSSEFAIPDRLRQKIIAQSKNTFIPTKTFKAKNTKVSGLDVRERKSLLKLVLGMAVGGYGYDPKGNFQNLVAEIRSDLDLNGLSMDADTIRKYLRQACELNRDVLSDE